MKSSLISAALIAFALVGCGDSPPGDGDLRDALTENFGGKAAVSKLDMASEIAKSKIIKCVKAEAGGYRCDFTSPLGSGSARFVKGDGGWIMMPQGG
jgi:hypothetical protein